MANYTGQQRFLLRDAQKYSDLGYKVGLAKGKTFLRLYKPDEGIGGWFGMVTKVPADNGDDFDGISLVPEGIVCVDIDIPDFGVVWEELPPTFKERTPRGWHLWYLLPSTIMLDESTVSLPLWSPKIKWRKHVDLLTMGIPSVSNKVAFKSRYKSTTGGPDHWGEHVLCSGTTGYQRVWPDEVPERDKLTLAPQWLQDALQK